VVYGKLYINLLSTRQMDIYGLLLVISIYVVRAKDG
jgi:hypothetical protein